MDAGKHVFCEKPLADTVEKCKEAEAIIAAHPELTFMLGFMRRYDHSYQVAKKKMENGDIGDVILVRCYSQDPISIIEGTLEYAPRSGGQFIDMSIHDFDLIRWLTGSEVKELWATGGCYEFKQYKDWDDGDNVSGLMKMENDAMAFFFAGRAAAHGSHVETEIVGTRGTLRIASVPTDSLVEVMSQHGVCRECYQDFITRWHDAYITEIEEFCDCVATGRKQLRRYRRHPVHQDRLPLQGVLPDRQEADPRIIVLETAFLFHIQFILSYLYSSLQTEYKYSLIQKETRESFDSRVSLFIPPPARCGSCGTRRPHHWTDKHALRPS